MSGANAGAIRRGRIFVDRLRLHAFHGHFVHERKYGQMFEIDLELVVDLVEAAGKRDPGVGDDRVEAAEGRDRRLDEPGGRLARRQIAAQRLDARAVTPARFGRLVEVARRRRGAKGERGAGLGQSLRDGAADAAARSGQKYAHGRGRTPFCLFARRVDVTTCARSIRA